MGFPVSDSELLASWLFLMQHRVTVYSFTDILLQRSGPGVAKEPVAYTRSFTTKREWAIGFVAGSWQLFGGSKECQS